MSRVHYRAVHTLSGWRKANNHDNLENAIEGKDGAAGLFARKVRIDYTKHGDPLYVFVWEDGSDHGWMIYPADGGVGRKHLPIHLVLGLEGEGGSSKKELDRLLMGQVND